MDIRQSLLQFLHEHPYSCAAELAVELATTRANIQYHLSNLLSQGEIQPVRMAPTGRGRPRKFFSLSARTRSNNYTLLADRLLALLLTAPLHFPETGEPQSGWAVLAKMMFPAPITKLTKTNRLNRFVKDLSLHGYQSRWEARAAGPEITFRNCPYAVLLPNHPDLCKMDQLIIENYLGVKVSQTSQISFQKSECRFSLQYPG